MTALHSVTPLFAVAGQLSPEDFALAAAAGFRAVINNRPENEEPGQPSAAAMRAAAETVGLAYHALPFQGAPPPGAVASMATVLAETRGPVLAYCRTGRRSILAWGLAKALMGDMRPDEIIAAAAKAGYDLEGAREALTALAPKP
ncbi:MAG: TIGR01244 family phosphatase [Hyphomonadaceae bacterium]|nr:TIGR01244 family phosphatase [Hyphomonadaceae bacterium]